MDWKALKSQVQKRTSQISSQFEAFSTVTSNSITEAWNSEEAIEFRQRIHQEAEGFGDWAKESAAISANKIERVWNAEGAIEFRRRIHQEVEELGDRTKEIAVLSADKIEKIWNSECSVRLRGTSKNAICVITGIQAVHARRNSIRTREEADLLKADIESTNEAMREDLNELLEEFGRFRVNALSATVGRFLHCLEKMKQSAKNKEYKFLSEINIPLSEIKEMERIDMRTSEATKTLAIGGGFAAIGLAGTPAIVTSVVSATCLASTGTAISSLSGAAATNAVLATLGGGTLAAGGGGVAAGAIVMGAITATATIGVAVAAIGTLASQFYSRKETEAEAYLAEVKEWAAKVESGWVVISSIKNRIDELHEVTSRLLQKSTVLMMQLEAFASSFNNEDVSQVKIFQQCALVARSMSELAQTPILDNDGNINTDISIVVKNTELLMSNKL